MYTLAVFFPGSATARHEVRVERSAEVLKRIPLLIEEHQGCERVEVRARGVRLFSVDRHGVRSPG